MSDTMVLAPATVMKIRGTNALSASKPAGYLHQIGGFVGVIVEDILGTGVAFVTGAVKGAPLSSGLGDGLGDMFIHGVFAIPVASGIAGALAVGDPVYYDGTNADRVTETNSGHLAGWVWPQDNASAVRAIAADDPQWMQDMSPAYVACHVKLAGFPKTGLV
jgi:predicted RecA/RadA family phage recombinase